MRLLAIELYGSRIGSLYENGGRYSLTFDAAYRALEGPPILSLSYLNSNRRAAAPTKTTVRLFPFFANLLPEPNSRLYDYLAAQSGVHKRDEMGLLRALGRDLPGAVTLREMQWETPVQFAADLPRAPRPLRFSLAGVQMKFSVLRDGNRFIVPPDGLGGTHILKLPEPGKPQLPENEAAMMQFAQRCGIDVPDITIVSASAVNGLPEAFAGFEGNAYVIERYDRSASGAVHAEDFAQILRVYPQDKYERVSYDLLMKLCYDVMGEGGLREFVRRLVFTIAIANADMHLKNWSVRYADPRVSLLAPAYDYVCTAAYAGCDDFMALPLASVLHWEALSMDTFLRAARGARVESRIVKHAVNEMRERIIGTWPGMAPEIPLAARRIIERQLALGLFAKH